MNYSLQRKYRSLERRREPKKMPKLPKLPEKVFYRILPDTGSGDKFENKKHVKFQVLGEDDDAKPVVPFSDLSPVPARYCASVCGMLIHLTFVFRYHLHDDAKREKYQELIME